MQDLENECGGHRIQRVPPNERRGRVHTSTVTVAVLESAPVQEVHFNDADFVVQWYSGTGAGGQNRNKVMASCRIIHRGTGITRTAQTRSRENSFKLAKEAILAALQNDGAKSAHNTLNAQRAKQIRSGMRGDKRRTYRFQDDVVQDDETSMRASCKRVMNGNFDLLWNASH